MGLRLIDKVQCNEKSETFSSGGSYSISLFAEREFPGESRIAIKAL